MHQPQQTGPTTLMSNGFVTNIEKKTNPKDRSREDQ